MDEILMNTELEMQTAIENMEKDKKEKLGKYSNMLNGLM